MMKSGGECELDAPIKFNSRVLGLMGEHDVLSRSRSPSLAAAFPSAVQYVSCIHKFHTRHGAALSTAERDARFVKHHKQPANASLERGTSSLWLPHILRSRRIKNWQMFHPTTRLKFSSCFLFHLPSYCSHMCSLLETEKSIIDWKQGWKCDDDFCWRNVGNVRFDRFRVKLKNTLGEWMETKSFKRD